MRFDPILTRNVGVPNSERIDVYLARGGYTALRKALGMSREALIAEVKESGLRGRGGAGFPAGLKWSFMPKGDETKYVCVNTDEGEPGTFKDRLLVEHDPHSIIEGTIIAAYAVNAHRAFVYIRGEFFLGVKRWIKAIDEAYRHGFLGKDILGSGFDLDLSVHRGAGAYICGEETALINSLEGKRGEPRIKPPYPAQIGLWGRPTLVHNVETLANIPHIVNRGAEWFKSIGTPKSTGPKLFCVSGHVRQRGNYELPLGTPLREIIFDYAGGMRGDKPLKAVIPGGASTPVLTAEYLDIPMDFESLAEAGSMLGTGAIIVMEEGTDMVDVARHLAHFFTHESCGKCTPCRVGSRQLADILDRIVAGEGRAGDIELLEDICANMLGNTFCPMGDAAVNPVLSTLKHFRNEYEYYIKYKRPLYGTREVTPFVEAGRKGVGRVLVIDDDPDFIEVTRIVLEQRGYEVLGASGGEEGLQIVQEQKPDLIILDVVMSSVLDGLNVARRLRSDEQYRDIPLVMVTSIANIDYMSLFTTDEKISPDAFLTKPLPADELLEHVGRLLS